MGSTATEDTGAKRADGMDKSISMCSANQGEKIPGPSVNETCHADRVSSLLRQLASSIGISQNK